MTINPTEISDIIKDKIKNLDIKTQSHNEGTVVSLTDGIARIYGITDALQGEMLEFPNNIYGLALNLERDSVGAVILGDYKSISEGDTVKCTGNILEVPVGDELLGRVVNSLGEPIDNGGPITTKLKSPIEKIAPGVIERKSVDQPVQTGLKSIDSMVPIGRGQRELIIGDRQTGKTAVAIDAIINQKDTGVKCIYVAIGQKASSIAAVVRKLEEHDALKHTIIVAASASDSAAMQYIAPYSGCAMGEYFRDSGEDALIVYDDLTKQAWAYRQVSLLLKRPPGREAYPGDVFYLHSRLLERSARINEDAVGDITGGKVKGKTGSLTALPIIETQAGDVSAFVPTNVISFSQFASDLDEATRKQLERGKRVTELMKQSQYSPLSVAGMAISLYAANEGYLDDVDLEKIISYEKSLHEFSAEKYPDLVEEINTNCDYDDDVAAKLKTLMDDFKEKGVY